MAEIEKAASVKGIEFEGKRVLLKEQAALFFGITERTIENYLARHEEELRHNGYDVIRGNRLKTLKNIIRDEHGTEIDFGTIARSSVLSVFDFRAFLNLAMLLTESDRARLLRKAILDIAIDTLHRRTGGATKYVNQRDEDYLESAFSGETYRKQFTDALKDCVDMGQFKYALFTDKVYEVIFLEKAREYRKILKLEESDKTRDTFYSEILDLVASFEYGFADALKKNNDRLSRKLTPFEVDALFKEFASQAHWKPLIEKARGRMASRDLVFRDALHKRLQNYVTPIDRAEFDKFLGDQSKELAKRLEEAKTVLKRLKDR